MSPLDREVVANGVDGDWCGPNSTYSAYSHFHLHENCASSLITRLLMRWQNSKCTILSWSERHWTTWILYGWNFKSASKIHLTLWSDMCKAIACVLADRCGPRCTDARTRAMFGSMRTERDRPGGDLLVMLSSWFHCCTQWWIASLNGATRWLSSHQNALCVAMMELVLRYQVMAQTHFLTLQRSMTN